MNKSLKISITAVGLYAGVLSFLHGLFEILQGFTTTDTILIFAISRSNPTTEMWHGDFPAMTLIPNYLFAGISVCLISGFIIFSLLKKKYKFIVLFPMAILLLLTGGGFVPPFLLIITGFSCLLTDRNMKENKKVKYRKLVKTVWIISIAILIVWSIAEWILGFFINSILVGIRTPLFLFGIILPVFILFTGFMNDNNYRGA